MEDEYDRYVKQMVGIMFNCVYRPIAGYINYCPGKLSDDDDDDFLLAVAKHEMLHALVNYYHLCTIMNLLVTLGVLKWFVSMVERSRWPTKNREEMPMVILQEMALGTNDKVMIELTSSLN